MRRLRLGICTILNENLHVLFGEEHIRLWIVRHVLFQQTPAQQRKFLDSNLIFANKL